MRLKKGKIYTVHIADRIISKDGRIYVVYICEECGQEVNIEKIDLECANYHMEYHSKANGGSIGRCKWCTKKYKKDTNWKSRYGHLTRNHRVNVWRKQKSATITGETVMWFGKYKGTELKAIPLDYLEWLYRKTDIKERVHNLYTYLQNEYKFV